MEYARFQGTGFEVEWIEETRNGNEVCIIMKRDRGAGKLPSGQWPQEQKVEIHGYQERGKIWFQAMEGNREEVRFAKIRDAMYHAATILMRPRASASAESVRQQVIAWFEEKG